MKLHSHPTLTEASARFPGIAPNPENYIPAFAIRRCVIYIVPSPSSIHSASPGNTIAPPAGC
jgi:hypothetical protein